MDRQTSVCPILLLVVCLREAILYVVKWSMTRFGRQDYNLSTSYRNHRETLLMESEELTRRWRLTWCGYCSLEVGRCCVHDLKRVSSKPRVSPITTALNNMHENHKPSADQLTLNPLKSLLTCLLEAMYRNHCFQTEMYL